MKPQRTPRRRKPPRRGAAAAKKAAPTAAAPMKVGGGGGGPGGPPKLVTGGGRPPGARKVPRKRPSTDGGVSFVTVLLLIVAVVIAGMMVKIMMPGSLDHLAGFPKPRGDKDNRNLLEEAQTVLFAREEPLVLTELQVNAYLRDRIKGAQGGTFSSLVKYQGTYVNFEKDTVELYVVRTVLGSNFPISSRLTLRKLGGRDTKWMSTGGSIGGLQTGAKQFEPVVKAVNRVAELCVEELKVLQAMGKITIEKDKVILDPNY